MSNDQAVRVFFEPYIWDYTEKVCLNVQLSTDYRKWHA